MEINQRLYDSASASTDSKSKAGKVLTTGAQKVGSAWQDFKSFINKVLFQPISIELKNSIMKREMYLIWLLP
jgi:hypothetical protein